MVAGNNNQVVFYDEDGGEEQNFDMSETPDGNGTILFVCIYVCIYVLYTCMFEKRMHSRSF